MTALLVDPWVLAFYEDREPAELYVERLLRLWEISNVPAIDVRVTARAAELLEEDSAYPLSQALPGALWPMRQDVYRVITTFVDKTSKLEDHPIRAVLTSGVVLDPGLGQESLHSLYLRELLALIAVRRHCRCCNDATVLSSAVEESVEIDVTADVIMVDFDASVCDAPEGRYCCNARVDSSIQEFLAQLSPPVIASEGHFLEAIALALWQTNSCDAENAFSSDGWCLGKDFVASAKHCGLFDNAGRMASALRTIVSLMTGTGARTTHWLRVGPGPGERQVSRHRDGAKAWRADIDDELHLHYWVGPNALEFANVVFHKNFSITE